MKRQNHLRLPSLKNSVDYRHDGRSSVDRTDNGKHSLSVSRDKTGLTSEHFRRAVAEMAYSFWEGRGHADGHANEDWIKAEAALKPLWSADQSFASEDPPSRNPGKL
jgi:hypothetical protein